MDKKDVAAKLASVLDMLVGDFDGFLYDNELEAIEDAVEALDELYQDLWREDNSIPARWWVINGDAVEVWCKSS